VRLAPRSILGALSASGAAGMGGATVRSSSATSSKQVRRPSWYAAPPPASTSKRSSPRVILPQRAGTRLATSETLVSMSLSKSPSGLDATQATRAMSRSEATIPPATGTWSLLLYSAS